MKTTGNVSTFHIESSSAQNDDSGRNGCKSLISPMTKHYIKNIGLVLFGLFDFITDILLSIQYYSEINNFGDELSNIRIYGIILLSSSTFGFIASMIGRYKQFMVPFKNTPKLNHSIISNSIINHKNSEQTNEVIENTKNSQKICKYVGTYTLR